MPQHYDVIRIWYSDLHEIRCLPTLKECEETAKTILEKAGMIIVSVHNDNASN
jgi:hypothetical protein